jgi:hypothetical protein
VIPFLGKLSSPKTDLEIKRKVDELSFYWYPILMGVVSREEMELASREDMQLYNELVIRKQMLLGLRGGDENG